MRLTSSGSFRSWAHGSRSCVSTTRVRELAGVAWQSAGGATHARGTVGLQVQSPPTPGTVARPRKVRETVACPAPFTLLCCRLVDIRLELRRDGPEVFQGLVSFILRIERACYRVGLVIPVV